MKFDKERRCPECSKLIKNLHIVDHKVEVMILDDNEKGASSTEYIFKCKCEHCGKGWRFVYADYDEAKLFLKSLKRIKGEEKQIAKKGE